MESWWRDRAERRRTSAGRGPATAMVTSVGVFINVDVYVYEFENIPFLLETYVFTLPTFSYLTRGPVAREAPKQIAAAAGAGQPQHRAAAERSHSKEDRRSTQRGRRQFQRQQSLYTSRRRPDKIITKIMIDLIRDTIDKQVIELKKLWANKRMLTFQLLNLAMIVFSALMIWKGLMFVTKVRRVVFFERGDLVFIECCVAYILCWDTFRFANCTTNPE